MDDRFLPEDESFEALIAAVERGETIIFTRHGAPVAELRKPRPGHHPRTIDLAELARVREATKIAGMTTADVVALIREERDGRDF